MTNDLDIAWLAGVFDGEGCVHVQKNRRGSGTVFYTVSVAIVNTSRRIVDRVMATIASMGIVPRVYCYSGDLKRFPNARPQYIVKVVAKRDVLTVVQVLRPHVTGKSDELDMATWFLKRQCAEKHHVTTADEKRVLDMMSQVKRNAGEASEEVFEAMRQVDRDDTTH